MHYTCTRMDSLRGSSVNIGRIQRRLAWPLRKDDTHTSTSVNSCVITPARARQTHPWTHAHTRARTHTHTHTRVRRPASTPASPQGYKHTKTAHAAICEHTHAYVCKRMCTLAFTCIRMPTQACARLHMHTHACARIRTHACMHACMHAVLASIRICIRASRFLRVLIAFHVC